MSSPALRLLLLLALLPLASCKGPGREAAGDPHAPEIEASAQDVLVKAYMERHRLGLGSPFRLVAIVLNDTRLSPERRDKLAASLITATSRGAGYRFDASALDEIGAAGRPYIHGTGTEHAELIASQIESASDPRAGELGVRLAYRMARVEGVVAESGERLAVKAAAMVRDRTIAREDARRLERAARARGVAPHALVEEWREELRFEVEAPGLAELPTQIEAEAATIAVATTQRLRGVSARSAKLFSFRFGRHALVPSLTALEAAALSSTAFGTAAPPVSAIRITTHWYSSALRTEAERMGPRVQQLAEWFVEHASNEERLVAAWAVLAHAGEEVPASVGRMMIAASVAMRGHGQEDVNASAAAPDDRELMDRFGLTAITYAPSVPESWRPHLRASFVSAVKDMRRIIPGLDVRGVSVHFGPAEGAGGARALAMHTSQRLLHLPPGTYGGTLAHELAHDLDWQLARRQFRVRGDYGTDRAVRTGSEPVRSLVQALSAVPLVVPTKGSRSATVDHASRPAEAFAGAVDWYVASSLARMGRTNPFLSTAQDDFLRGFGTAHPPVSIPAAAAVVALLSQVVALEAESRDAYLARYGQARWPSLRDIVDRSMLLDRDRPAEIPAKLGLEVFLQPVLAASGVMAEWECEQPLPIGAGSNFEARNALALTAAQARARAEGMRYAEQVAGGNGRYWLGRRLYGGNWPDAPLDDSTVAALEIVALRIESIRAPSPMNSRTSPFEIHRVPEGCPGMFWVPPGR
jgi:hypothetical protein